MGLKTHLVPASFSRYVQRKELSVSLLLITGVCYRMNSHVFASPISYVAKCVIPLIRLDSPDNNTLITNCS